jgi:hypothetical protein
MASGRRRLRSSQRVPRSSSRRPPSSIWVCVSALTWLSSRSICAHWSRIWKISRDAL